MKSEEKGKGNGQDRFRSNIYVMRFIGEKRSVEESLNRTDPRIQEYYKSSDLKDLDPT